MDLPEEVVEQLGELEDSVDTLADFLQPFLDATPRELEDALVPLELAKAHVTLAKAVVLLAQLRLRLRGEVMEDSHPLQQEQKRLERYDNKVRRAVNDDTLARTRPGTELNVAAANRFIAQAIPDLTPEQRQRLREQRGGGGGGGRQRGGVKRVPAAGAEELGGGSKRVKGGDSGGSDDDLEDILAAAAGDKEGS